MKAEEMFRSYTAKKQEVDLLKFRITNFRGIDADEVIKSMCLAKPEGEKVQEGETSDRTASVALNYRKTADRLEDEMFDGLFRAVPAEKGGDRVFPLLRQPLKREAAGGHNGHGGGRDGLAGAFREVRRLPYHDREIQEEGAERDGCFLRNPGEKRSGSDAELK